MNGGTHLEADQPGVLQESQNSMDLGSIMQWTAEGDEERRLSGGNAEASGAHHTQLSRVGFCVGFGGQHLPVRILYAVACLYLLCSDARHWLQPVTSAADTPDTIHPEAARLQASSHYMHIVKPSGEGSLQPLNLTLSV